MPIPVLPPLHAHHSPLSRPKIVPQPLPLAPSQGWLEMPQPESGAEHSPDALKSGQREQE